MALARSCPRASLSCRTTRARRATCTALSITTARPTMVVTAAICLALMLSRMGSAVHQDESRRHGGRGDSRARNRFFLFPAWSPAPEFIQLVVQRLETDAEDL